MAPEDRESADRESADRESADRESADRESADRESKTRTAAEARDAVGEILDAITAVDRMASGLAAVRFELVAQAQRVALIAEDVMGTSAPDLTRRAFRAELACALLIPEPTADRLCAEAETLVHDLPSTLSALREGLLNERKARVLVDHLAGLEEDDRAAVERIAIPLAATLTVAKFERRVRSLRERRVPEQSIERHRSARETRDVVLAPEHDGMAWLGARLPAVEAVAIHTRLDATARSLRREGDSRTLAQLRADLFCSILLEGEGRADTGLAAVERATYQAIRPQVIVTIPALSLLGHDDGPADLEGYGPVDAQTARRLVGDSPTLQRLLTDPLTGAELSLDRRRYRVTEELRTWLRVRDGGCRFPGCGRAARACDVDHTRDWVLDGQTAHNNLAHLCRSHHIVKHQSSWRVDHSERRPGDLAWHSPIGRRYSTEPAFERAPAAAGWFSGAPPG